MADTKKNSRDLNDVADRIRDVFQDLLKIHVKDKKSVASLAAVLGKTESLVKKMAYKGEGGLDVWVKAFAHLYNLDESNFKNLKDQLRKSAPASESDKIWFSLKDELGASEEDALYLALCAQQALSIKHELDSLKKKRKPRS